MAGPAEGLFALSTLPGYTPLAVPVSRTKAVLAQPSPPASGRNKGVSPPLTARSKAAADDAAAVHTVEDALAYFERWGEDATCQFFYALPSATDAEGSAAAEYFLRIVPPTRTTNAQSCYYIVSRRQLVKVDRRMGETDTIPLAEWLAYKKAYITMREQMKFFGSFALAKCFQRWQTNYHLRRLRRRRQRLQSQLLLACPAFQGMLMEAAGLLEGLQSVRAAVVQPGRLYTVAEWAEQQGNWRTRKAQPEIEAAVAVLVQAVEAACTQVEANAELMLASVKASELQDRIGVDLYAATSSAKTRSMQAIRADKEARAHAYHRALADRRQLPRLLRLLDLRLVSSLAGMAVGSVAGTATALQAAAPGLLLEADGEAAAAEGASDNSELSESAAGHGGEAAARGVARASNPALFCSLVVEPDGSIGFSPSEAEWAAAIKSEAVASSLRLAGGVQPLLALPAFECYQGPAAEGPKDGQELSQPTGADQLAQQDGVLVDASAQLSALLQHSFAQARHLARQHYQQYLAIYSFDQTWDFEAWEAEQREAIDLTGTEATLRQLQTWQQQLEEMPARQTAGLLCLDAAHLLACLQPVVADAQGRVIGVLTELAGNKCRALLSELAKWEEVAAARPPDVESGFQPWAAELALMQREVSGQLAAAAAIDAALELVEAFAGRLPTAEAVKRDDLREVARGLPVALTAAAAWHAEQQAMHVVALAEQARVLAEEAIQLEGELKMGVYGDAGAAAVEVLADLELQHAHIVSAAAQAEALAQLQLELGSEPYSGEETREAGAALQRCIEVWTLVAEAEALQASLAAADPWDAKDGGAAPHQAPTPQDQASRQVAALQEQLAVARGSTATPDAIWLRASNAVLSCRQLLAG